MSDTPPGVGHTDSIESHDSSDKQQDKKKSRRPANTAFRQQRLKAWQPILTPKTVLPLFFTIGIIFAPIGGLLLYASSEVQELRIDYTSCGEAQRAQDAHRHHHHHHHLYRDLSLGRQQNRPPQQQPRPQPHRHLPRPPLYDRRDHRKGSESARRLLSPASTSASSSLAPPASGPPSPTDAASRRSASASTLAGPPGPRRPSVAPRSFLPEAGK